MIHYIIKIKGKLKRYRDKIKQYRQKRIFQNNERKFYEPVSRGRIYEGILTTGCKTILDQNMGTERI